MKASLVVIIFVATLPAVAEEKDQNMEIAPTTYKECIQKASDVNIKWIEYKADVNKCRDKFGIPSEY